MLANSNDELAADGIYVLYWPGGSDHLSHR